MTTTLRQQQRHDELGHEHTGQAPYDNEHDARLNTGASHNHDDHRPHDQPTRHAQQPQNEPHTNIQYSFHRPQHRLHRKPQRHLVTTMWRNEKLQKLPEQRIQPHKKRTTRGGPWLLATTHDGSRRGRARTRLRHDTRTWAPLGWRDESPHDKDNADEDKAETSQVYSPMTTTVSRQERHDELCHEQTGQAPHANEHDLNTTPGPATTTTTIDNRTTSKRDTHSSPTTHQH